ncbi:zeatin O-glucosyltransferase-like [Silene latifolia]|uniref:zeatin O-glucosyltransferase-like n=1 Tax=Silene latifolia TaxID=37657 RepID=UPI003D77789B
MESNDVHNNPEVVVVMVPFPAQGHLNQLLHFSHIITSYGIPVHYVGSGPHNHQAKLRLHGWSSQQSNQIHFHDFQLLDYKTILPPKPDPSIHWPVHFQPLFHATVHLRQPIAKLLHQLSVSFKRVVVVHDSLMTTVVEDVKSIPNAESYVFIPTSAFTTLLGYLGNSPAKLFQLDPDLPRNIPSEEGCVPTEIAEFITNQYQSLGTESGRLYNTSRVIEGRFLELLEKISKNSELKNYAIGPLNPGVGQAQTRSNGETERHRCLRWLDEQEKASVLYVAFGSTTSLSREQTNELARGLESSGHKFIWVLRKADEIDGFTQDEEEVPDGFEERVMGTGMVVREWAPQLEILAHPATGGFMSHCGWNSCMESISMGVPLAAWPMHSEQPKNSYLVSQVLRIGIVVREWEKRDELVTSSTIENAVKMLMASKEGKEMKDRVAELSYALGGSSMSDAAALNRLEIDTFISHITRTVIGKLG